MDRQEVVSYLIMEATSDPIKPRNLQVFDTKGLFYLIFEAWLQSFNVFNRNGRNYGLDVMIESLNAPHIQELVSKKSWKGEAGHPMTEDVKRILTIDPKLTSHKINSFQIIGNRLLGQVETLDDNSFGSQMTKNILQGMEPAFSLRALAKLIKQADGRSLVRSRAHIVCYDWVILPSHQDAYRDQSKPIEKIYKAMDGITANNIATESAVTLAVQESQIKDFIAMESSNVKMISNICEVALGSMKLTKDLSHVILKEGQNTYAVKIEDKIKHDVRNYMSNL